MPRTAGVSSSSTVWWSRRRPSPRTVARWLARVLIGLRTSVTFTVLPGGVFAGLPLAALFTSSFAAMSLLHDLFDTLAALGGDLRGRGHGRERIERSAHHVVRVGRPEALGQYILHAHHLEHRAHGPARDDASSIRGRLDQHFS